MKYLLAFLALAPTLTAQVTTYEDLAYGLDPKEHADIHIPTGSTDRACLIFVHGRGDILAEEDAPYPMGVQVTDPIWADVLAANVAIISVDYPAAPGSSFPTQWWSVQAAFQVARGLADGTYPGLPFSDQWEPDRIGVMGSSIGASIVGVIVGAGSWDPAFAIYNRPVMDWNLMVPGFGSNPPILGMTPAEIAANRNLASPNWWFNQATSPLPTLPLPPSMLHNEDAAPGIVPVGPHDPLHGDFAEIMLALRNTPVLKLHGAPQQSSDILFWVQTYAP